MALEDQIKMEAESLGRRAVVCGWKWPAGTIVRSGDSCFRISDFGGDCYEARHGTGLWKNVNTLDAPWPDFGDRLTELALADLVTEKGGKVNLSHTSVSTPGRWYEGSTLVESCIIALESVRETVQ